VYGSSFVPHMYELDFRPEHGIEDRHNVVAGQRKDPSATKPLERLGDDIGSAQVLRHVAILHFCFQISGRKARWY
jgi:hypothetical protein